MYHNIKYRHEDKDKREQRKEIARKEFYNLSNRDFVRIVIDDLDYLEVFIKYMTQNKDGKETEKLLETLQEYQEIVSNNIAEMSIKDISDYFIDEIIPADELSKLVEIISSMKLRLIYRIFTA